VATLRAETTPSTKLPVLGLDVTEEEADKNPADARSIGLHGAAGEVGWVIDTIPEDHGSQCAQSSPALNSSFEILSSR